jgi:hypothetical protein
MSFNVAAHPQGLVFHSMLSEMKPARQRFQLGLQLQIAGEY